jgi:nicotinamidase-related amidase
MNHEALLIIDVQLGLIEEPRSAYEGSAVVSRIESLIRKARASKTPVIYVQHDGDEGGPVAVGSEGWQIHPAIRPAEGETIVRKQASDSFHETTLGEELERRAIRRLYVVGCRTEYCVDTTCRRAISLGYDVTLVSDAHTTIDNGVLSAAQIIAHHNATLDDFGTDAHVVALQAAEEIDFQ